MPTTGKMAAERHVGGKPIRTGHFPRACAGTNRSYAANRSPTLLVFLRMDLVYRPMLVSILPPMAACIILDIAEQKTAHVLNVRPDERYRTLILACSEWIARLSSDGRILYPIRTPWPLPFTEKTGCSWLNEIIPCQDRATLINTLNRAITKKQPIKGTIRIYLTAASIGYSRAVPIMAKAAKLMNGSS